MRHCLVFLLIVLSAFLQLTAQTPTPDLKKPDALFAAGLASNGLVGDDLKPWHLKANYDIFDKKNTIIATGVFEEWWAAKDKWKRSYTGDHYSGTEYELPEGYSHEGNAWKPAPWPESLIVSKLLAPIGDLKAPSTFSDAWHTGVTENPGALELYTLSTTKPPLTCLRSFRPQTPNSSNNFLGYCFEPGRTELRLSGFSSLNSFYNKLGLFQGRSIALETAVRVNNHELIKIHVVSLTGLTPADFGVFTPSTAVTARKKSDPVSVPGKVLAGKKLSGANPSYPSEAKANSEQGLVILSAVINEQGKIQDAKVLEAPSNILADAALSAVRTWTYQPYLLDGQPVNVNTTINVVYNLGR